MENEKETKQCCIETKKIMDQISIMFPIKQGDIIFCTVCDQPINNIKK